VSELICVTDDPMSSRKRKEVTPRAASIAVTQTGRIQRVLVRDDQERVKVFLSTAWCEERIDGSTAAGLGRMTDHLVTFRTVQSAS